MNDTEIVPFVADHAHYILKTGLQLDERHNWYDQAYIMEEAGFCVTLLANKKALLSTGIIPVWDGVGEAWLLTSKEVPKYPITIARAIYECFYQWVDAKDLWRVHANVRSDWDVAIRFAKFLGMKEEGLMEKFGPEKADYFRLAWVRE
tara:strand:- start:2338 stop:2781 length:444 start_codon:yes stop_codon:yes gene_type:complete